MSDSPDLATDIHFYASEDHHRLAFDPIKAIVAPRPIGWISTLDLEGTANLAPYSFFNIFSSSPQILIFGSEGRKDSIRNAEATGEFVWNLATRPLADRMNLTSGSYPPDVDEFEVAGLTPAPCRLVRPPRVAESPAALECKVVDVIQMRAVGGAPLNNFLALGQVVGVHIDARFIKNGMFDTKAAQPIMRAGYRGDYACVGEMFEMLRPS